MSDPRPYVTPLHTGVTRRELLLGGAALTLTALAPRAFAQDASVEGIARRTVGEHELIALLDGRLTLDPGLFAGASDEELAALVGAAPLSGYINAFVVRSPGGVVMIDAGAGSLFGPTAGATAKLMAAAEIDPTDVDTFYVTHLHGDHVGALIGDDPLSLPNAQMVLHERERAFWFDDAMMAQAGEQMAPFFEAARAAVGTFGERVTTFAGSDVPGPLTAMELFGHTPGHTGYVVADGDDTVLVWGDIVHAPALQFPRPDVTIAFDVDQDAARATRERLLDTVATDGTAVAGMHLVFPALGTVTRSADGYAFETDG